MFTKISVLVDNNSWILPYAEQLVEELKQAEFDARLVRSQQEIPVGDVCFLLGCTQLVNQENLAKNKFNMVVHESALPQGKGFAPIAWQLLDGQNTIPVCLIEATENADAGDIWLQDEIKLTGTELCQEWRKLQGEISVKLAKRFISEFDQLSPSKQTGEASFYSKRSPQDSELDINKTLAEQFELLRTVDNQAYPAFFHYRGKRFKLEITQDE